LNRENFKENAKIALMFAGIFALIAIPVAIAQYYLTYHFSATVSVDETVTAYFESACTTPIPEPYDFGSVEDQTVISVWIRNDGNVQVDVTLTISAETDCTVTPSWTATTLTVGQIQQLDMTISTVATPGASISWGLDIDSNKSP